jgi:hypothetical protein
MRNTVAKPQQLDREDQSQIIQDLADDLRIGYGAYQQILTAELGMHHVTAQFVPRILTADQKQQCVNVCEELSTACLRRCNLFVQGYQW